MTFTIPATRNTKAISGFIGFTNERKFVISIVFITDLKVASKGDEVFLLVNCQFSHIVC